MTENNPEALDWITSERVCDFAANKFDYKHNAIDFIKKLYINGAEKVLINSESIQVEFDELYADAIIVRLPEDFSKRNKVLQFCQTESQPGCYLEIKENLVFLWWD